MTWRNWPNLLTLLRLAFLGPLLFLLFSVHHGEHGPRLAALVLFIAMALSDGLDGFLARRLGQETALGKILDPLADKLVITGSVVLLSLESTGLPGFRLPYWVPAVAIGKDVITIAGIIILLSNARLIPSHPHRLGKSCTAVQYLTVALTLAVPDLAVWREGFRTIWKSLYGLATLLAIVALLDYTRTGIRALRSRPLGLGMENRHP